MMKAYAKITTNEISDRMFQHFLKTSSRGHIDVNYSVKHHLFAQDIEQHFFNISPYSPIQTEKRAHIKSKPSIDNHPESCINTVLSTHFEPLSEHFGLKKVKSVKISIFENYFERFYHFSIV